MDRFSEFKPIPGSDRPQLAGVQVGRPNPNEVIEVIALLRRTKSIDLESAVAGRFIGRQELGERFGASVRDYGLLLLFARRFGLDARIADLDSRMVILQGTIRAFEAAFRTELVNVLRAGDDHIYRSRKGPLFIAAELVDIAQIFGLDNRPVAKPHFRRSARMHPGAGKPDAFDGNQLAGIYNFPAGTGNGQKIGLIELGGGFKQSDIQTFFAALNLSVPKLVSVDVAGGANDPGQDEDADTEVCLDIECAGAVAPQSTIVVYFAENTTSGFLQAILTAIHDTDNLLNVLSISWGGSESTWTAQQMTAMDDAFQSAAALGISVFVAAGDDGANDNVSDGNAHVDFPASSPSVTACGGTTLLMQNNARQECVWNDGDGSATGGGISDFFGLPQYQQATPMPVSLTSGKSGRGLPDVSANADPDSGYATFADGTWTIVGGTSAVAPLYAGLMARINEVLAKSSGLINPVLYQAGIKCGFYDITQGNNSCDGVTGYSAGPGWDAVSGWGTPGGLALMNLLSTRGGGLQSGGAKS